MRLFFWVPKTFAKDIVGNELFTILHWNFCLSKHMVGSISPILLEVGIPNLVCGYIFGVRTVTHCFQIKVYCFQITFIWTFDFSSWNILSLGAKCRVDNILVTLTEFSRSPSFKVLSYKQVVGFSPNLHRYIVWKGKRINKILVTLTLFPWSHQHFVISNVNQNCVFTW